MGQLLGPVFWGRLADLQGRRTAILHLGLVLKELQATGGAPPSCSVPCRARNRSSKSEVSVWPRPWRRGYGTWRWPLGLREAPES